MDAITEQERNLISQLKEKVTDLELSNEHNEDRFLVRWIRARDHDLGKAENMLRNSLEWRRLNDMDNILTWSAPENIQKEFPLLISEAVDKDGCSVGFAAFGRWDIKSVIANGQRDMFLRYIDQYFEAMMAKSHANGGNEFVVIVDMEHYSFRQLTAFRAVDAIIEIVRRFESNQPETMKAALVLNVSRVFLMLFTILKPILPAKTLSKVQLYGPNSNKWKEFVHDTIPLKFLPVKFGGTNSEADKILFGVGPAGTLDPKNIIENDTLDWKPIIKRIPARTSHEVEFNVTKPGSILEWSFRTDNYDIGFVIYDENQDEVYAYKKYESKTHPEKGFLRCTKTGKYSLCFDNKYSQFREKKVYYTADLLSPCNETYPGSE